MFDAYELKARVIPSILALLPLFITGIVLFCSGTTKEAGTLVVVAAFALAYLGTLLISSRGRQLEAGLFAKWGGIPSVQVLRHRDLTFTTVEKLRFHAKLAERTQRQVPTEVDEANRPQWADEQYKAMSDWLRSNARDVARFPTVAARNAEYGFYRNMFAARPIGAGVAVAVIVAMVLLATLTQVYGETPGIPDLRAGKEIFIAGIGAAYAVLYRVAFTEHRIKGAGFRYARALVEQCDAL